MNRLDPERGQSLRAILGAAQRRGFVGPGPLDPHIERALDLTAGVSPPDGLSLDLGSGGGLPGLPLALAWPSSHWILLDGSLTRAQFLADAVARLELADRVTVEGQRAELAARGPLRGQVDLVVARSFASPAVTAECGGPFLRLGGRLVIAEPPGGQPDRWDADRLSILGLALGTRVTGRTAYQVLLQSGPCPDRFPRRVGVPSKRPLF